MKRVDPDSNDGVLSGRWVTDVQFSRLTGLSRQTLANWRLRDRDAGRIRRGYPVWRLFGGCVRYWVDESLLPHVDDPAAIGAETTGSNQRS
jgi:hypothetical protein